MPNVIDRHGNVLREEAIPTVFAADPSGKRNAIFRAVHRERANPRAGTASTKRRDEVRGGGRKPWKQKGTGRARQGSTRSPQWRHGGVVFGPSPRSYVTSLNKKERRAALLAALSERLNDGAVTLLDTSSLVLEKTRDCARLLFGSQKGAKTGLTTLVVYSETERGGIGAQLARTGANLQRVMVVANTALDVKDVLGFKHLVFTTGAFEAVVTTLGPVRTAATEAKA